MKQSNVNDFFDLMVKRKMYSSKANLQFYLNTLFENVDLTQKEVLDVGGGSGLLSYYAAVKGAQKAICLEPEFAGSTSGMIKKFYDLRKDFPASLPVELSTHTLQEYLQQAGVEKYDVVIMHNSINHLDEEAGIQLLKSDASYRTYLSIFEKVFRIMKKGGVLIVTDCSCDNFFNDIGMKNIFTPTIEWHKHQRPGTWITLFKAAGFSNPTIKWLSPNRLGKPGTFIMGNYLMSYLTRSYFKVTIVK
ncbi:MULTISPECIES: class I SAM-dependent methyltransferase [Niastella]|uniref:Class I SAM-dependent methyltransferase n=1 Tax=Niastella soli TaxID=2821487 RepID=A0ABS3Z457_9BACT|nr:class I SAM-dependent methyltransferase [Niastella soli]MBO9204161.1 class I SAM-dependent methyltransferase [Niastella soli]